MYKVEALDTYKKLNAIDSELKRIPEEGEQFEVSKERLEVLLGKNKHNKAFVKLVHQEEKKENKKLKPKTEKAKK